MPGSVSASPSQKLSVSATRCQSNSDCFAVRGRCVGPDIRGISGAGGSCWIASSSADTADGSCWSNIRSASMASAACISASTPSMSKAIAAPARRCSPPPQAFKGEPGRLLLRFLLRLPGRAGEHLARDDDVDVEHFPMVRP